MKTNTWYVSMSTLQPVDAELIGLSTANKVSVGQVSFWIKGGPYLTSTDNS